jgi:hypothetical protein
VLSDVEQKAASERKPRRADHVESTPTPRARRKAPLAFVVLWWVSVLAVIVGAKLPGLGMAAAVGLGWLLWRYLPGMGDMPHAASDAPDDGDDATRAEIEVALRRRSVPARSPHPRGVR